MSPEICQVPPLYSMTRRHRTPVGRSCLSMQAIWQALHPVHSVWSKKKPYLAPFAV
ncbi:hypothetical protein JCM18920_2861 [Cutibacterium acnes JCM 18920]|nr:hypothetical protein JCM18920_2861 [Cutibacterium acnes JCM 18920]